MSKAKSKTGRKKGDKKKELLSQAIHHWASDVVKYKDADQLTASDLTLLLEDSSSQGVWNHLVNCIHPSASASRTKQNLQVHLGSEVTRNVDLQVRKMEAEAEVKSMGLAVAHMEEEIARLRKNITAVERENLAVRHEMSNGRRRECLLEAFSLKTQEDEGLLREYTSRLKLRKELFCSTEGEVSYFVQQSSEKHKHSSRNLVLESACKKNVKKLCNLVKEYLEKKEVKTSSEEAVKVQMWSGIEALLSAHSGTAVMRSLGEVAEQEATEIRKLTTSLDPQQEAASLKCMCVQSVDDAEPSFLKSVEDHLLKLQLANIRRSLEAQRTKASGRTACLQLEDFKGQIDDLLWKQLSLESDQEKRNLVSEWVLAGLKVSSSEASLTTLSQLCSELDSAREQCRLAQEQLREKKSRIDKFAEVVESRQTVIKQLVKLNSSAKARLQKQRTEVELYVQQTVCGHEGVVLSLGAGLVPWGRTELQQFSQVDLTRLIRTTLLNTPTCDLAIHRLRVEQPSGLPQLVEVLSLLGLPPYTPPHALLTHVTKLLDQVMTSSQELGHQERMILRVKQHLVKKDDCRGVLQASQAYDSQLLGTGMETISSCKSRASAALAKCSQVLQLLQDWWSEPAQWTAPWVLYQDMSLTRWHEEWKILTAKLRQLST